MSSDLDDPKTTRSLPPGSGGKKGQGLCLLVVEGTHSSIVHLPRNGSISVGTGPDADLRLDDSTVSRKHARILIAEGEARVVDLESRNGTWVNGERVEASQSVEPGDAIALGEVTLIVRSVGAPHVNGRAPMAASQLRRRAEEEVDRAARYGRSLSVVIIGLGKEPADVGAVTAVASGAIQPHGVFAWSGASHLLVLVPELDADAAERLVADLPKALTPHVSEARIGIASFPDDGCDADTLIASARFASSKAIAGGVTKARDIPSLIEVGDRTIVVGDPAVSRLYVLIQRLAASDLPVLVSGETGAGKEYAAYAVHAWSARSRNPFVVLNCAALQDTLIESELFGHEKGAFTGAVSSKPGLFETAQGGTVFLDEVGDLSPSGQAKLLRVLETRRLTRLGDVRERDVDIRLVCATHRDLDAEVNAGRFRRDLYFRLSAGTITLPPLRERPREVPLLARRFLSAGCAKLGRSEIAISPAAMKALACYAWPGNVRELKNVMEYAAAVLDDDELQLWHLPDKVLGKTAPSEIKEEIEAPAPVAKTVSFRAVSDELRELERRRMREALEACGGVQRRAAELIGMPLRTFAMKFKQYGFGSSD